MARNATQKYIYSQTFNIGILADKERHVLPIWTNYHNPVEIWGIKWTINFMWDANIHQTFVRPGVGTINRTDHEPWILDWGLGVNSMMITDLGGLLAYYPPPAGEPYMREYPEFYLIADRQIFEKEQNLAFTYTTTAPISTQLNGIQQGGTTVGEVDVGGIPGAFDGAFGISDVTGTMTTPVYSFRRQTTTSVYATNTNRIWKSSQIKGKMSTKRTIKKDDALCITLANNFWIGKIYILVQFFSTPL